MPLRHGTYVSPQAMAQQVEHAKLEADTELEETASTYDDDCDEDYDAMYEDEELDEAGVDLDDVEMDEDIETDVDLDVVKYTGGPADDSAAAIVVYMDGAVAQFEFIGGEDNYCEGYTDGYADALSRLGHVCEINQWKYDESLAEGDEPPDRFSELESALLTRVTE